jgi:hypothetical protein
MEGSPSWRLVGRVEFHRPGMIDNYAREAPRFPDPAQAVH